MTAPTILALDTLRLHLRPFTLADAPAVQTLAGAAEVAATTLNIPHPYPAGLAEQWIEGHAGAAQRREGFTWAVVRRSDDELMGAIGIHLTPRHRRAEVGYWLGVPFWNQGYMTEAASAVVASGFGELMLHRVQALVLPRNGASARVAQKAGLRYEGLLRGYLLKGEVFEDVAVYAAIRLDRTS